jgi:GNAT superfamily N-acetyltransferase
MSVIVRSAEERDKARCLDLLGELVSTGSGGSPHPRAGDALDLLLTQERGQVVVAEDETGILGMATVTYNLAMRYGGEYCQLEELIVSPQARGKNVGAMLVQQTVDNAKSRGCGEFGLYLVESTEHNRPFYEKFGFEVVGTEMRQKLV